MDKTINKIIIAAAVVLFLLIVFTLLFRGIFRRTTPGESPTPVPTGSAEVGVLPGGLAQQGEDPLIEEDEHLDGPQSFSADEMNRLNALKGRGRIETDDFIIDYSPLLNEFFISKKTPAADEELREFFQNEQLLPVYEDGYGMFNEVGDSLDETIVEAEDEYDTGKEDSGGGRTGGSKRDRDLKLFTDLLKTTLSFDLSGGKRLRDVLRSLGDDSDTGGGRSGSQPVSATAQELLRNPRITLSSVARQDLQAGIIDERLVDILASMLQDHTLSIWGFKTGHSQFIAGTNTVSNHYYGRAADIGSVDGKPVGPSNQGAHDIVRWTTGLKGEIRPGEVGSPWPEFDPLSGWYSDSAHQNHLHIGYYAK